METLTTNPIGIKALKFHGYKIELSTNIKGQPVARFSKFVTVGINKGQYKRIEAFYFPTMERRDKYVSETIKRITERTNDKNTRQQKKADIRANFTNPFKVGQIYYTSWGYDQTNVDFYEIVEVKGKQVKIQEIGAKSVQGSEGMMCCSVVPDNRHKEGDPLTKMVQFYLNSKDEPTFYVKDKYGHYTLMPYDKEEKGVYCSWYA